MEGSFKNKLLEHEVIPPSAVWNKIAQRLDEEFVPSDAALSEKMENTTVTPPFGAWDNISSTLHPQRARIVPLVYRRVAFAAGILGLIALSAIYFIDNNNRDTIAPNSVAVTNNAAIAPLAPARSSPPADTAATTSKTIAAVNAPKRSGFARPASSRKSNNISSEPAYFTYAEMEMQPSPVQARMDLQPVEVEAPPIRDARGNIIMDYSVITNPNEPYITVTSPSGSQTKISSKFLHCLSYINSDFSSSDINPEGRQWKSRFEEWRNKLLAEGTFVPAASNFFDIFELKALIEEQ